MSEDTVSLTLPLSLAKQIDELAQETDKSPVGVIAAGISCLAILRWTVINFGGAFPSGRIPEAPLDD